MPGELDRVPMTVLKLCCENVIETGNMHLVDSHSLLEQAQALGISQGQLYAALGELHQRAYIKPYTLNRRNIRHFAVTFDCFQTYGKAYIQNYDEMIQAVAYWVVNDTGADVRSIATDLNQPPVVVEHFLEVLEGMALIKLDRPPTGLVVTYVSAHLKHAMGET